MQLVRWEEEKVVWQKYVDHSPSQQVGQVRDHQFLDLTCHQTFSTRHQQLLSFGGLLDTSTAVTGRGARAICSCSDCETGLLQAQRIWEYTGLSQGNKVEYPNSILSGYYTRE